MPDIRTIVVTSLEQGTVMDWAQLPDGELDETQALATAVIVALGSDRLAAPDDELPNPGDTDRRGWWGDMDAEEIWGGWPIGSRLWLLSRAKIVGPEAREGATVARVEAYINECILPFQVNRMISGFTVEVERDDIDRISARVVLYRGPLPSIDLRFQSLWDEIGQ